ncbi:MAG: C45 family autoproteolytic acyltransferase/hydrolase [Candidatus Thermoplasmatota archaeon]|jgi:outer membrane protein assembly factor BamB|nr:C45 family autoproteolytic acyltransferase/hydrolase [Candidatus Thermoplasmatota archaeon]
MKKIYCMMLLVIVLLQVFLSNYLAEGVHDEFKTIGSEYYKGGYRYNIQGWIYLHIEGEPYERGYQYGYLASAEIVDIIQRWSRLFPEKWSWKIHKRTAMQLFWNKYPEEYKQEIKGIADGVADRGGVVDGAAVNYKDILTLNEMYEMLTRTRSLFIHPFRSRVKLLLSNFLKAGFSSYTEYADHCSAFIATGDATADGRIVASHSTFSFAFDGIWWHLYTAERFNVILDIQPSDGYRILMTTSPGLIWSDEDFNQNNAGMILMGTSLKMGPWSKVGDPVVVRSRKAIQYSDSIDEMISYLLKKNNGLYANDWLMGDTKTGEIASLELALHNYGLNRTKNGFIWSCNNVKNDRVRWELTSIFGLGVIGRVVSRKFVPSDRDIKFEELRDEYYGKIDVDVAKKIMTTSPIHSGSMDCKITDSQLVNDFGFWAFMGKPDGTDFIASEHPFKKVKPGYTDMPACGWVQLYALSSPNKYYTTDQKKTSNERKKSSILWKYETKGNELGNAVYSSPAISDNILYATSWNGEIFALDGKTGRQLWEKNIGCSSTSSPIIFDNTVYIGSSDGLYALDKNSGDIIWAREDIGTVSSKSAFLEGVVYCSSHDNNVYALNSENGDLKWKFETKGEIYSSPVINKNVLYVGSNDGYLYAIDTKNGEVKWKYKTGQAICSSPLISNDFVYFGSWDNNLYALDAKTGKLKWRFTAGWGIDSSPVIYKDMIYVGSEDNNMYALDVDDGTLRWFFSTDGGIKSSPTVYGGFVFFGSSDGRFYAVNAEDGGLEWSVAPDYHIEGIYNYVTKPIVSSPVACDGRIYVGSTNGKIYCFDAQTFEQPMPAVKEIKIPVETWLFLVLPVFFVIIATTFYLYWYKRRTR